MILCPCAGWAFTFLPDQKSKQKSQVKTNGLPALPASEFLNRRAFVVGNGFKTALVVGVEVVHALIAFFVEGVNGKQTIAAAQVVQVALVAGGIGFYFVGGIHNGFSY